MKLLSTLMLTLLLAGCASTQVAVPISRPDLYADSAFARSPETRITAEQIFAMSPEMKEYAAGIKRVRSYKDLNVGLFNALYERAQLRLEYDAEITRTAAQAFEARSGNCLSLVLMTAAFAHELGLKVQYQRITSEDTWSRSGSLYFSSGHVNMLLGKSNLDAPTVYDQAQYLTIDFLPPPDAEKMPTQLIEERTVVAMYMNNRAAESMVRGKLDDAYWWSRAAIDNDPSFLMAYNTLATVYQRHGNIDLAERTLRFAHQYDPNNTVVLFNLAELTDQLGKKEESAKFKADLAILEPYPPFYFFKIGQQAMDEGDYRKARAMFVREVQRAPYYHEFHFWLAKSALALGNLKEADKHMDLALSNSTTRSDSAIYASKLANLRLYEERVRLRPGKI